MKKGAIPLRQSEDGDRLVDAVEEMAPHSPVAQNWASESQVTNLEEARLIDFVREDADGSLENRNIPEGEGAQDSRVPDAEDIQEDIQEEYMWDTPMLVEDGNSGSLLDETVLYEFDSAELEGAVDLELAMETNMTPEISLYEAVSTNIALLKLPSLRWNWHHVPDSSEIIFCTFEKFCEGTPSPKKSKFNLVNESKVICCIIFNLFNRLSSLFFSFLLIYPA